MLPCTHTFVVDEPSEEVFRDVGMPLDRVAGIRRRCLLCGFYYLRSGVLDNLRLGIRARHRLRRLPTDVQADLNRQEGL